MSMSMIDDSYSIDSLVDQLNHYRAGEKVSPLDQKIQYLANGNFKLLATFAMNNLPQQHYLQTEDTLQRVHPSRIYLPITEDLSAYEYANDRKNEGFYAYDKTLAPGTLKYEFGSHKLVGDESLVSKLSFIALIALGLIAEIV